MRRRTVDLAGGDAHQLKGPFAGTLAAISLGASSMGALTYIGNAPNLFIYAIAVERGVAVPSFFGFTVWSSVILPPVLAIVGWVYFGQIGTVRRSLRRRTSIAREDGSGPWGCLCRPESNDAEPPFLMRNITVTGRAYNLEGHSVAFPTGD